MQLRIWLKRFDTAFSIFFFGFCFVMWTVGSCRAGRFLGLDDLIPAANRWLDLWR
jgi:hypothetical protein